MVERLSAAPMRHLLALLLLLSTCSITAQERYTFGVVPQFEPGRIAATWQPILRELEKRTGFRIELVGAPGIPAFEQAFMAGAYDFAYMNPYHSVLAGEQQGYVPLVRDGGRELFGVLVVHRDSPLQLVAELDGKTVAFPAPNALGASLLIRADLDQIHQIQVQPLYTQTHSSTYLQVALGRVAAGGGVLSTLLQQPLPVRNRLRIIYRTRGMPPHPITAHPRVPVAVRTQMQQALLDLAATTTAAALLADVPLIDMHRATLEEYAPLRQWGLERYFISSPAPTAPPRSP